MYSHLTNKEFLNLVEGQPVNDDVYREMISRLRKSNDKIEIEKIKEFAYNKGYEDAQEDTREDFIDEGKSEVLEYFRSKAEILKDECHWDREDIETVLDWIDSYDA